MYKTNYVSIIALFLILSYSCQKKVNDEVPDSDNNTEIGISLTQAIDIVKTKLICDDSRDTSTITNVESTMISSV